MQTKKEIATALRDKYKERNTPGYFESQDVGIQAINYLEDLKNYLPDSDNMFILLADLIDPTCRMIEDEPSDFHCSACGHERIFLPVGWRHCPYCGARILNIDWIEDETY